ncbi:MAG: plastocyanin/azurin family copper-binding protein [Candidatus Korobacteraceae bacterium]|jgi:plastocyanin
MKGMFMTRSFLITLLLVTAVAAAAVAGTIEGTISPGRSVVYVDTIQGKTFSAPTQKPLVEHKGMMFSPHILVIQQGMTVEFLNSDNVQHNVFWPSISGNKKLGHNLGTWPKGEKRSFKFDQPGVVPLLCNAHPEMAGYIIVSPTPYFAETDDNGNYKLENIPDGEYNLVVWHEGMKRQTKALSFSGTSKVDFSFSR